VSGTGYQGDFLAWNGGALLIGEGTGAIAPHAHYSIQIVLGLPGGLRVQTGKAAPGSPVPGPSSLHASCTPSI
jgi:AraC family transcriptional regulator